VKKKRTLAEYTYSGKYDQKAFTTAYTSKFAKVPKFNQASMPDLLYLLNKIGSDARISDVRWAAYMLATVFVESSETVKIQKVTVDKKGRKKTHTMKVWRNFAPIDEKGHGKGRDYYLPVKVTKLPTGDAQVCEYDGESWTVSAQTGKERAAHRSQQRGVAPSTKATDAYNDDDGDEQYYYGRGFVQLTWWDGYARAGVVLEKGLDLLFDPELVNEPDTAYDILATGMCTGTIYANGRTFSKYFHGTTTDYVNARNMVNGGAKHANKVEVAQIAEHFEDVLFASKVAQPVAAK
jgi:hypothetical protein